MPDPDATRLAQARRQIVANAMWGVEHTGEIHYLQKRPLEGLNEYRKVPLWTDCSGFVTLCYRWGGAADPNGKDFSGEAYTGYIVDHCVEIGDGAAGLELGDLVVLDQGTHQHVVVVVGDGPDPAVVSHGREAGPLLSTVQEQIRSHHPPVWFLTCPDLADPGAQRHLDLAAVDDDGRTMANAPTEA